MGVKVTLHDAIHTVHKFRAATGWYFTDKGTLAINDDDRRIAEFNAGAIFSVELYKSCCNGKGECACI